MGKSLTRIDHVAVCVRPENIHTAAKKFAELLQLDLEGPLEPEGFGLTVYIDWEAGFEIYAPHDPSIAKEQAEFLEERGEGVFRLVFSFPDQGQALENARALGYDATRLVDVLQQPDWSDRLRDRIDVALESFIEPPIHGVRIDIAQIERRGKP